MTRTLPTTLPRMTREYRTAKVIRAASDTALLSRISCEKKKGAERRFSVFAKDKPDRIFPDLAFKKKKIQSISLSLRDDSEGSLEVSKGKGEDELLSPSYKKKQVFSPISSVT